MAAQSIAAARLLRVTTWRILTWNAHGAAKPSLVAMADVLRASEADAVALQEVRRGQAARLAELLGWQQRWIFKHNPWTPLLWWRAEGMAILSTWPLDDVWRACLSPGVSRLSFRRRVVIGATVHRHGDDLRLFDTHLATDSVDLRIAQARTITARILDERPPLVVVAGDLNAAVDVELLREFGPAGLVSASDAPTSPAHAPIRRLDDVLVPGDADVVDTWTPDGGEPWTELSDHLPTLVAFTPSRRDPDGPQIRSQ